MSQTKQTARKLSLLLTDVVRFLAVCFLLLLTGVYLYTRVGTPTHVSAATSSHLNFQARLANINGSVVPDGYYNVEFKLYDALSGGSNLWTETRLNNATQGVRVHGGYLSVNLGSVNAFPAIDWDQDLYLTMNVGDTAPTCTPFASCSPDGEMTPRIKLTAVPYAFQAKQAERLNDNQGTYTGILEFDTLTSSNKTQTLQDLTGTVALQSVSTLSTGGVTFANSTGQLIQDATNFFWDEGTDRLGLGTAGPDRRLDILDASNPQLRLTHTDGSVYTDLQTTASGYLSLAPSGGRLGVNTTAPDQAVEINSATGNNLRLTYNDSDGSATNYTDFNLGSDGTLTVQSNGTNPDLEIRTAGFDNAIFIDDDTDRVGIGTASPSDTLSVAGTAYISQKLAVGSLGNTTTPADPGGFGLLDSSILDIGETITVITDAELAIGINNSALIDLSSSSTGFYASQLNLAATDAGMATDLGFIYGSTNIVHHNGSGTIAAAVGVAADVVNNGSGIIGEAIGFNTSLSGIAVGATGFNGLVSGVLEATGMRLDVTGDEAVGGFLSVNGTTSAIGLQVAGTAGASDTNVDILVGNSVPLGDYGLYIDTAKDSYFAGNLGIGDTTPAYALTVGDTDLFGVSSTGVVTLNPLNASTTLCLNGDKEIINCTGSGGIDPNVTLQNTYNNDGDGSDTRIDLTDEDDSIVFSNPLSNGSDSDFVLKIEQLATGSSKSGLLVVNAGGASGYSFRVNDDGTDSDSTPFIIDSAGSVGIGTSGPLFDVVTAVRNQDSYSGLSINNSHSGTSAYAVLYATNDGGTGTGYAALGAGGANYGGHGGLFQDRAFVSAGADLQGLVLNTEAVQPIVFGVNDSEVARFTSTGNLGLGDTSPDAKLEVLATTEQLRLTHTDNTIDTRFLVDGSGNLTLDASADGTGSETFTLTGFSTLTATDLTAFNCTDCIDFDDLEDTLDLDTALILNQTTNTWSQTFTGTTTTGLSYAANSLTSGKAVQISSSSAGQTTATLLDVIQSGTTTGYTGNVVNLQGSSTTGAANVLNVSSANTSSGTAINVVSNALTAGKSLNVTSSATAFTGQLVDISLTGNNASNTGTLLRVTNGNNASNANANLVVFTNGGTGNSFRVNDDGTDTDSTPFVIDQLGNVGIGTATPVFTFGGFGLHVRGPATGGAIFRVQAGSAGEVAMIELGDSTSTRWHIQNNTADEFTITETGIGDRLNILSGGNIGIGDTTPDQLLEVMSSAAANTQLTVSNTNAGSFDAQIGFELSDGTNTFTLGVDDSDSDKFKISTTGLGTNDRFVIDGSGNVGINTSGPDRRLDVLDASNPQLRLTQADGTVYTDFQTTSSGYLTLTPSGGRLGVNTSAPDSTFEINSAGGTNLRLTYNDNNGSAANYADLLMGSSGTLTIQSNGASPGANILLRTDSFTNALLVDDTNNYVSIAGATGSLSGRDLVVADLDITTSARLGSATNGVSFNDGLANKFRLRGTARNDRGATLVPEYAGATLTGTGIGTMTSDFCSGSSVRNINTSICASTVEHNFYSWTTNQGSNQDYAIYIRYQIPNDFDDADSGAATWGAYGWRTDSSNSATVSIFDFDDTSTPCGTETNVASGSDGAWNTSAQSITTSLCDFNAGDTITIRIVLNASQNEFVRVGEIIFGYKSVF